MSDDLPTFSAIEGISPPAGRGVTLKEAAQMFKPRIDGYDIEDRIGEGGMATVWVALGVAGADGCACG